MGLGEGDSVVAVATTNGKKPDAEDETDDADTTVNIVDADEELIEAIEDEIIEDDPVTEESES